MAATKTIAASAKAGSSQRAVARLPTLAHEPHSGAPDDDAQYAREDDSPSRDAAAVIVGGCAGFSAAFSAAVILVVSSARGCGALWRAAGNGRPVRRFEIDSGALPRAAAVNALKVLKALVGRGLAHVEDVAIAEDRPVLVIEAAPGHLVLPGSKAGLQRHGELATV
jgi:hypothetical protein